MEENQIVIPSYAKEDVLRILPPQGFEVDEIKVVDGFLTVTFKEAKPKLPRSWEEFCEMQTENTIFYYITEDSNVIPYEEDGEYNKTTDRNLLPDRATAEAVLALCQLIQLRNCYNGDWVPDWNEEKIKYFIEFCNNGIQKNEFYHRKSSPLYFKTEELRDEFLRYFRPLIEKLKPLYGIKKGGEE